MSTLLISKTSGVELLRFSGGKDRGACLQMSRPAWQPKGSGIRSMFDTMSVTRSEALSLARDLLAFAAEDETTIFD